ncbi:right-handed parallel beta-helix repeat-containing protein [Kitasatospora sp. LaBMicrA B282]|uniref:right-handed parallel beta-helix repeat-containing protein n=1 Tax=Kitasatospora sp. LaBMicrA B282 TaxID=3420949 RepID=UPI003D0A5086
MPTRRARHLAGATAGLLIGLGGASPAHAATVRVVHPGESIQRAVDGAQPGDTILVLPGTYHESVQIGTPRLTLRGTGRQTVITRGPDGSAGACAQAGHGICVTGAAGQRIAGDRIESLTVAGFAKNGISASETDRLTVRDVLARDNGEEGISQEKSTRGRFEHDEAAHNGQAGIFLANIAYGKGGAIDTEGARISDDSLHDNRMGVVVRRVRDLTVEHNSITGNCAGVFVVGDDGRPRTGALTVRQNRVDRNNAYCPPTSTLPFVQGTGIVLTGVESTLVTHNEVDGNVGASPFSGGIVLFRSFVGGPSAGNTISDNTAADNGPADLADRDGGPDNTFSRNTCHISEPAGRC